MNDFETALLAVLASIDQRLEALVDAGATTAPNYQRRLADFTSFNWPAIGATVLEADEFGPAAVEWRGMRYTRRSPQNKFDAAIWFSRAAGKDEDGTVRYERLITFKEQAEPEPLSRKMVDELAKIAPPPAVPSPKPQDPTGNPQSVIPVPVHETGHQPGTALSGADDRPNQPPAANPPTPAPLNGTAKTVVRSQALAPDLLKRWLEQEAARYATRTASPSTLSVVARAMAAIVPDTDRRHELDEWLTGYHSMKDMPGSWLLALHGWMKPSKEAEPTDKWVRDEVGLVLDLLNSAHLQKLASSNPASRYAPATPEQKELI